jgi:hypothetical protein
MNRPQFGRSVMSAIEVQIPESLHKSLRLLAEHDGISVDQFVATSIAEKVAAILTAECLEARAKKESRAAYEAVLQKVPDVAAEPYDAFPPTVEPPAWLLRHGGLDRR